MNGGGVVLQRMHVRCRVPDRRTVTSGETWQRSRRTWKLMGAYRVRLLLRGIEVHVRMEQ